MDTTHCFYIITTVKPNVRVNRLRAVLPHARGLFTPSMGQNGFIGAHFKLVITYVLVIQSFKDMCHTQSICTSTLVLHNYASTIYGYKNTQLFPEGGRAVLGYPTRRTSLPWSTQPSLSLFVQPPSHLHRLLHRSPARWHLQFPLQATLQPQWRSSEHAWLTSDRSVQYGTHSFVLVFHSQPHSLGFGISGAVCME